MEVKYIKFHGVYATMKARCNNPNTEKYKLYGARGIKCEWKSFDEFKNDMFESYKLHQKKFGKDNTSIDRIDNNGNYCKANCRWATYKEQGRNRRDNRLLTFKGETHTLTDWCFIKNISKNTLAPRLNKHGWSVEEALTTPPGKYIGRFDRARSIHNT